MKYLSPFRGKTIIIYLASQSARRKELLREAKISFRVVKSNFKEHTYPGGPRQTVIQNAIGKVKHARVNAKHGIILGADTLVFLKKRLLGKPKSKKEAFRMLKSLSGTTHDVYTGIALFNLETKKWKKAAVRSCVMMRLFDDKTARYYLNKINPLDKAGAYAIQEHGDQLIKKIKGSYTNVVGLPIEKLKQMLKNK